MATGKLIVLNAGSSAGKTSIAREFQELAPDCWMHLGIDVFWFALPLSQCDLQQVRPEYYTWDAVADADGVQSLTVTPGPLLDKAMLARYRAIKAYLDDGINVIADEMFWKRDWLVDFLRTFEGYEVWLVALHVSDEEGARRDIERGRTAGWNRGSTQAAHADAEYDFELDTTGVPVPTLARELHAKYLTCSHPGAFERLSKRYLS